MNRILLDMRINLIVVVVFTISERSSYNDIPPDIKLAIVEYIKECSTEQQQIVSTDNRKNQKLVIVPIKSKKRHCHGIKVSHIRKERKLSTTRD